MGNVHSSDRLAPKVIGAVVCLSLSLSQQAGAVLAKATGHYPQGVTPPTPLVSPAPTYSFGEHLSEQAVATERITLPGPVIDMRTGKDGTVFLNYDQPFGGKLVTIDANERIADIGPADEFSIQEHGETVHRAITFLFGVDQRTILGYGTEPGLQIGVATGNDIFDYENPEMGLVCNGDDCSPVIIADAIVTEPGLPSYRQLTIFAPINAEVAQSLSKSQLLKNLPDGPVSDHLAQQLYDEYRFGLENIEQAIDFGEFLELTSGASKSGETVEFPGLWVEVWWAAQAVPEARNGKSHRIVMSPEGDVAYMTFINHGSVELIRITRSPDGFHGFNIDRPTIVNDYPASANPEIAVLNDNKVAITSTVIENGYQKQIIDVLRYDGINWYPVSQEVIFQEIDANITEATIASQGDSYCVAFRTTSGDIKARVVNADGTVREFDIEGSEGDQQLSITYRNGFPVLFMTGINQDGSSYMTNVALVSNVVFLPAILREIQ